MSDDEKSLANRLIRVEAHIERIISDVESEKATRARVNADLYKKLDEIRDRADQKFEKLLDNQATNAKITWMILGGMVALSYVPSFVSFLKGH